LRRAWHKGARSHVHLARIGAPSPQGRMCQTMSDRDRTKTGGDAKQVRDHLRKVLSKLAAFQHEKHIQKRAKPKVEPDRD
jgi:hypothetical protein